MIELLKKYIASGEKTNALLVGQNLFNKNKGDKEVFSLYFSLLLETTLDNEENIEKAVEQMVNVLSIYAENTELNENEVNFIRECESKITKVLATAQEEKEKKKIEELKRVITTNDSLLNTAKTKLVELSAASDRESFNNILKEIYDLDIDFDKDNFVMRQRKEYEDITTKCQRIVDIRLKEFDRLDNVDYNLKAVESYEKVFKLFSNAEKVTYNSNYISDFFSYDSSRLTNETLVYYNHVYNYVLSKLNDEEKILLTKAAIKAEKRGCF